MQMNLDLAEVLGLHLRENIEELTVVLLRRIEVRMSEFSAVAVADKIARYACDIEIFTQPPKLSFLVENSVRRPAGFKMIRNRNDQVLLLERRRFKE